MAKKVVFCGGDKGGVSKSVTASVLADAFVAAGRQVAVIEGDTKTPDVGRRFKDSESVKAAALPLNRAGAAEDAVGRLAIWLEQEGADVVIINLPANSGDTLDAMAPIFRQVTDALGYELWATYALGKFQDAAQALAGSLTGGMLAHIAPERRIVIYPAFITPASEFAWAKAAARKEHVAHEAVMPALAPAFVYDLVMGIPGGFEEILATPPEGFTVYHKAVLRAWIDVARTALAPVLEG